MPEFINGTYVPDSSLPLSPKQKLWLIENRRGAIFESREQEEKQIKRFYSRLKYGFGEDIDEIINIVESFDENQVKQLVLLIQDTHLTGIHNHPGGVRLSYY
jgi:hypothetical protein